MIHQLNNDASIYQQYNNNINLILVGRHCYNITYFIFIGHHFTGRHFLRANEHCWSVKLIVRFQIMWFGILIPCKGKSCTDMHKLISNK